MPRATALVLSRDGVNGADKQGRHASETAKPIVWALQGAPHEVREHVRAKARTGAYRL